MPRPAGGRFLTRKALDDRLRWRHNVLIRLFFWGKWMSFLKRHGGLILAFCVIAPIYFIWTWTSQLGAIDSDGPAYLMMAQHYSTNTVHDSVASIAASFSRFPPLYPLALAHLHVASDLRMAHAATTFFLMLALLAMYRWLLEERLSHGQASLLVLVFASLPGSWLLGLLFQSEYLYLAWSLLALTGMSAFAQRQRKEALYLAALAVAAAALTRTVGITLLVPLLLLSLRAPRRVAALALFVALAPLILWSATHQHGGGYLGSLYLYKDHPLQQLRDQLSNEIPALRFGFEQNFTEIRGFSPLVDLVGAFALTGAAVRARRLKPDGVYVLVYTCLMLVWPYPDEARRFVWVIVPILLGQSALVIASLPTGFAERWRLQAATGAVAGAALLSSLPAIALASERAQSARDFGRPEARGTLYWYDADAARAERWVETELLLTDAMRRIDLEIPQQDCVLSVRPELINYFSHRHSTYPPPDSVADPEFAGRLKATGCRYVFMTRRTYTGFPEPMYPFERLGGKLKVVDSCQLPPARYGNDSWIGVLAKLD